jgi:hypothetical protein
MCNIVECERRSIKLVSEPHNITEKGTIKLVIL